jgi:hypothetical protein
VFWALFVLLMKMNERSQQFVTLFNAVAIAATNFMHAYIHEVT